jgi:chromosomal replication initiator protein
VAEENELAPYWEAALASLTEDELPAQQRAFVTLTQPLGLVGDTALVAAPNDFTKDVLETRLRPIVVRALTATIGQEVRLAVTVDPSITPAVDDVTTDEMADATYADDTIDPANTVSPAPTAPWEETRATDTRPGTGSPDTRSGDGRLNDKYIFDTFVIGSSNRFAHAAAVAVAEQPARAYNPLFIYGGSGLGKTHLLHAIGHYTRTLYKGTHVRYVSSEEFTNEFINSIRDDKAAAFQRRYRETDVLLVDDIQFLSGKVQTQEEFFHTFNTLHNANKRLFHSFNENLRFYHHSTPHIGYHFCSVANHL